MLLEGRITNKQKQNKGMWVITLWLTGTVKIGSWLLLDPHRTLYGKKQKEILHTNIVFIYITNKNRDEQYVHFYFWWWYSLLDFVGRI